MSTTTNTEPATNQNQNQSQSQSPPPSRPPPPVKRKSLLQKLNKKHEALISHMRAKRTAKETEPRDEPKSPSRSWKLSRRDSTIAPSVTSTTRSETEEPEGGARDYRVEEVVPFSAVTPLESEETGRDFWYAGTRDDSLIERSESPSLLSRPDSANVDSETILLNETEERRGRWLDKPGNDEDVDVVHLERSLSVDSAKTKVDSKFGKEDVSRVGGDETQLYEHQERENTGIVEELLEVDEEVASVESEVVVDLPSEGQDPEAEPVAAEEEKEIGATTRVETEPLESIDVQTGDVETEAPKLLSLPDGIFDRLALQLDTTSTSDLRLSCKKLYNMLPSSAPTATSDKEPETLSPQPNLFSPPPPPLPYCGECAQHHPWTQSDFYLDASQTQRCRHYLHSARQPKNHILGTGNYHCENCNTVRRDQKCRTCLKCEECADLRRNWIIISWVEDQCDACVASHSPQWKHWKDEFDGRLNPGAHREWMGV